MAGIDPNKPFVPLKFAVLTISDTRELTDDKSGATLSERIKAAGHIVFERTIVRDDVEAIRARVKEWIDTPAVDVVVTTGGTGFTGRDVTPEAVEPLFEKRMEAFAGPAPARMPGTRFSSNSSTIATALATSSRSCRGSMSTCAVPRQGARRCEVGRLANETAVVASQLAGSSPLAFITLPVSGVTRNLKKALPASGCLVAAPLAPAKLV